MAHINYIHLSNEEISILFVALEMTLKHKEATTTDKKITRKLIKKFATQIVGVR